MKKLLLVAVGILFLFSGCAYKNASSEQGMQDVGKTISIAEVKYQDVHARGIAFQKTKELIDSAKKLASEGKNVEALKLANKAIYEADRASEQAVESTKNWRLAMPQAL